MSSHVPIISFKNYQLTTSFDSFIFPPILPLLHSFKANPPYASDHFIYRYFSMYLQNIRALFNVNMKPTSHLKVNNNSLIPSISSVKNMHFFSISPASQMTGM